jgi:hypothetical protein
MTHHVPIDLSAPDPTPEPKFTEGFKDPGETAPWWLLNFYLEVPFYFPYLDGAKFNIYLHQEKWAAPVAAKRREADRFATSDCPGDSRRLAGHGQC